MYDLLQHTLLVQPEAARQIAHAGHEHHIGDEVGRSRRKLPEQIPAVYAALDVVATGVPRARDNVGVRFLLDANHLWDKFGVVAEVSVHNDHIVACGVLKTMNVGCSKTELALTRLQVDMFGAPELLELFGDFKGAVGGAIVDDDNFPVQVAIG